MNDLSAVNLKTLLVIGNGFDLQCKLHTSFQDYFYYLTKESKYATTLELFVQELSPEVMEKHGRIILNSALWRELTGESDRGISVQRLTQIDSYDLTSEKLSFFDILFLLLHSFTVNQDFGSTWADVELQLHDWCLGNAEISFPTVLEHLNLLSKSLKSTENIEMSPLEMAVDFVLINNFKIYKYFGHSLDESTFVDFLMEQLKAFERKLGYYIGNVCMKKASESGDYYVDNAVMLFRRLLGNRTKPSGNEVEANVLSFNYTHPRVEQTLYMKGIYSNVHGREEQPIIGIDMAGLADDSPYFRFTKTYRIMCDTDKQNYEDTVLSADIKRIVFYGHSLVDADLSYFQSIFDNYDLYSSNVRLEFCYSTFPWNASPESIAKIQRTNYESVFKLINKYGKSLGGAHGNNLLHKLVLEHRVSLRQVPSI